MTTMTNIFGDTAIAQITVTCTNPTQDEIFRLVDENFSDYKGQYRTFSYSYSEDTHTLMIGIFN